MNETRVHDPAAVRRAVRDRYAGIAAGGSCCGPAPASLLTVETGAPGTRLRGTRLSGPVVAGVLVAGEPAASAADRDAGSEKPAELGFPDLGCGNPLAFAGLAEGETVLDLGCGAGAEVLAAARRVGPTGRAIGVDMTDEMLERARASLRGSGLRNVEFLKGEIESLPLPDASVDVIVSNCVLNLSPDKAAALGEAFRVLRPGGRFVVADIVLEGSEEPDASWRADLSRWTSCEAGALSEEAYARALREAGFGDVRMERIGAGATDPCFQDGGIGMESGAGADVPVTNGGCATRTASGPEIRLVSDLISARKPGPATGAGGSPRAGADARPVRVQAGDLPALATLLEATGLDPIGLEEPNVRAFAVGDADGAAASVAYEVAGSAVLVRSLAVRPDLRGRGLGGTLLEHALEQARKEGAIEAFLLTETAGPFFAGRGWETVERSTVDARFPDSEQVRSVCPASATAMRRGI